MNIYAFDRFLGLFLAFCLYIMCKFALTFVMKRIY